MPKVKLSVSVDDKHLDRFSEVVKKIKKAGMKVEQELDKLGIVTGSIDSSKLKSLQEVDGVANVEQERKYHIPPPDSEVQ